MQDKYSSGTELPLPGIWHNLDDLEGLSVHLARNVMRQCLSNLIKPVLGGQGVEGWNLEHMIVQLRKMKMSLNWKLLSAVLKEEDSYIGKYKASQYLFWQV